MKKKIAIVCGGDSGEYDISIQSAAVVKKHIDADLYQSYLVHIRGKDWNCILDDDSRIPVDRHDFSFNQDGERVTFDGVFIAIHGTPGEDGLLQAYFDLLKIPYTSSGFLCSSLTFNKAVTNRLVTSYGVNVAESWYAKALYDGLDKDILKKISLPCFVKPNAGGSSVGMSKVNESDELQAALERAFKEDAEVLIEEFISGREFTCGVFRYQGEIMKFPITEIVSKKEFFDYEAKYTAGMAEEITPAPISDELKGIIQAKASRIYDILDCKGIVRVDFIHTGKKLFFLELNTVPGLSEASIVPQQAEVMGISLSKLFSMALEEIF